jgi:glycosyltransferase involved in cell wall biosynthesis
VSTAPAAAPAPGGPLRGEHIIIFSSDDWESGLKTSKYHLARQLARENQVLFVNSVGLRAPTAGSRDIGRALGKLAAFFRGARRVPEGLHVFTPIVIPFRRGSPVVKRLNGILLRLTLRWLMFRLGLSRPVVFAFLPTFNDVVGRLGERAVVYYCIDDMRGYAGVDLEWFEREETRLLDQAACVIGSARQLAEEFGARGYDAHYVPHGVDWDLFRRAVDEDLPLPDDLKDIPEPRLGFYGFLSDEWVDYPLLKRMAAAHPEWHIVLIGRPKAGMNLEALVPEPNIHCLGLKPFEQLPAYTRHFAVGLIPFRLNQLTLHSNPLKLLEYLAGGLPVVCTDIPEARAYDPWAAVATNADAFIAQCETAIADDSPEDRRRRSAMAREHSWETRVATIGSLVTARLHPPAGSHLG